MTVTRLPSTRPDPVPHVLHEGFWAAFGERPFLADVTFVATQGEVAVVMGPSGVGKTVNQGFAFGLIDPAEGWTVSGTTGGAAGIGALVFQQGGGLGHLSVRQNLLLVTRDEASVDRLLGEDRFNLKPDRLASQLSGGEKRRLAASVAAAAGKRLLWMDEPAAGLDIEQVEKLGTELRSLARRDDVAIVVTTHRADFAAAIADRILYQSFDGSLSEVTSPGGRWRAGDGPELDAALRRRLAAEGPRPDGGRRRRRRLLPLVDAAAVAVDGVASVVPIAAPDSPGARPTFLRSLRLAAWEGAFFYPLIGLIFGGIFLLVFLLTLPMISTARLLVEFGPTVVIRLSPAFAAILVGSRAGSAIAAWVGQWSAARLITFFELAGTDVRRRLLGPVWLGLAVSGPVATGTFALAVTSVFAGYLTVTGEGSIGALLGNFEAGAVALAAAKTAGFGAAVASVTVASAAAPKDDPTEVASAITRGIVGSAVAVMAVELVVLCIQLVTA